MSEVERSTMNRLLKMFSSEILLGFLVAVLSVFAAWASYQGALADSVEVDANVEAQKVLSLSNTELIRTSQEIIQDYTLYDSYYFSQDEDALAYYEANFSIELQGSIDRPSGPFDDQYYDEMYVEADAIFEEAATKFDEAQQQGDRADNFQLVVLIMAVGLSLAAWASLVQSESLMRPIFSIGALTTLIYGLIIFFNLL